jgi:alcohol dehydrogenase
MATNPSDDLGIMFFLEQVKTMAASSVIANRSHYTTAGTGSETDGGAVITNPDTNEKTGVFGAGTMPALYY